MSFLADIFRDNLSHTCTIEAAGVRDQYGIPAVGDPQLGIQCLGSGSKTRVINQNGEVIAHDFMVQFNDATEVKLNDQVSKVVDQFGRTVFERGTIVAVQENQSGTEGLVGITTFIRSDK